MNATCLTCNTTFHGVDRNEDGSPYIESVRCADPGCEVYLCPAGCEHLSFKCGGCGARFCNEHKIEVADGLDCCPSCAAECMPEIDPQPVVRRRLAILAEAGCTLEEARAYLHQGVVA